MNAPWTAPTLTTQVMEHVRRAVVAQTMLPGELYSVHRLSEELGISRSPVRDGLLRLEEAGLVRFERNRGFRVVPTRPEDVAEIFAIRLALEVPAARRAARYAGAATPDRLAEQDAAMRDAAGRGDEDAFFDHDQRLHEEVMLAGRTRRAAETVARLRVHTRILGASTAADESRTFDDIRTEHAPVLAAITAGDPEAAGAAMAAHLRSTGRLLVAQACRLQNTDRTPDAIWDEVTQDF
ncbi:GntR family transcriptional regulator [Nocardiopsis coralliicola]